MSGRGKSQLTWGALQPDRVFRVLEPIAEMMDIDKRTKAQPSRGSSWTNACFILHGLYGLSKSKSLRSQNHWPSRFPQNQNFMIPKVPRHLPFQLPECTHQCRLPVVSNKSKGGAKRLRAELVALLNYSPPLHSPILKRGHQG